MIPVGQTATAIATSLNGCVSWQALGVSGYDSTKILERLIPKLPDARDGYHPSEESYGEFGRHMADRLLGIAKGGQSGASNLYALSHTYQSH